MILDLVLITSQVLSKDLFEIPGLDILVPLLKLTLWALDFVKDLDCKSQI